MTYVPVKLVKAVFELFKKRQSYHQTKSAKAFQPYAFAKIKFAFAHFYFAFAKNIFAFANFKYAFAKINFEKAKK